MRIPICQYQSTGETKMYDGFLADRETWYSDIQTYKGNALIPVGELPSPRSRNKKKTHYFFHKENTREIYWKRGQGMPVYRTMANSRKDMEAYYGYFTGEITPEDREYCNRFGVILYA